LTTRAHDVRFGGTWTRTQALKNDMIHALVRASLSLTTPLPRPVLRAMGRALGSVAYALSGRLAIENVRAALRTTDREARRIAHACFRNLGGHLGDLVSVLGGRPFEPLDIAPGSLETIERARRQGRGVIFASAHLGPWERVAATLIAHGVPLVTVARESYDPRLDRLYDTLRGRAGLRCIYRGDPRAPLRILRALREGLVLGMPMDLRTRAESVSVPFFGIPTLFVVGPARLALRTGAPIVVGTVEARLSEHVESPTPGVEGARSQGLAITVASIDHAATELLLTARLSEEIERRIRSIPEEWPWMHPRW
jgi:KDO2-lipid IV(A) lauroyltransferase